MKFLRRPKPSPPHPLHGNPLLAVPRIATDIDTRKDKDGTLHLRRSIPPQGRLQSLLSRKFHWKREHYINLDERGTAFWNLIDGSRNLRTIASLLAELWGTDETECQRAVLLYTRALMIRTLVTIELSPSSGEDSP